MSDYYAQSLPELIALRAVNQPHDPAVHTGTAEFGEELKTLTYLQVHKAVNRLAAHYSQLGLQPPSQPNEIPPERVIAVLTSTAIDESLLEIALAKLGLTSLLLSVNNSVAAVAHLVKQTKSSHLIYGSKFEATAREVQQILAKEDYALDIVADRRFPLWGKDGVDETEIPDYPALLTPDQDSKRTCVILHSSGSTGFPKPVYVTHYGLIANLAMALPQPGFSALPVFHGFGHYSIFRCIYHGVPFTLMPPHIPLTSANICQVIRSSPSPPTQHFAVPYVLKLLGETEEGTKVLASFQAVSFAGAAVPDDLGDRLVTAGVNLISVYGTTETGSLLNSRRDYSKDTAWNWLRAEGAIEEFLQMEPLGSNTFELVVKDGWPAKILSNRPDGSYATKDIFAQHPDHPTWFKYVGRLDDTLTQTLGEKTNPVPIELAIRGNSPLVQECIVFGDGKPQVGCLILPSDQASELAQDKKAYIQAIWPVIEQANAAAPTHSRILPDMIDVLPVGTEIPVATKLSILRPACYKKFAPIIDAVYERFERGTGQAKQVVTTQPDMEAFLTQTLTSTLGEKGSSDITPETDLFAYGVDSLQATRVRNVISRSLELGNVNLGQNVVYEYPSVSKLAKHLLQLRDGGSKTRTTEDDHAAMLAMVDKWSSQVLLASKGSEDKQVIVLTGATGSLGAHILKCLVNLPVVSRVICLSRAKSHDESLSRIQHSLSLRLCALSLSSEAKITSYAADVNAPLLGLTHAEFDSIQQEATAVIHNAWPVNFVLGLESFDAHIGGVVNLLNLCQSSPKSRKPTFFFSSSVATRQGRPDPVVREEFPDKPETAAGMGYGRSKWVVEKVMERAAAVSDVRVGVLRIGQLVGDTTNGVWNETEAWPLMFKAANTTGALPMLEETPSWLPVDLAARIVSEIVTSVPDGNANVYHVLNPEFSKWSDILDGLRMGGLEFETVDRQEWLERLAKSTDDLTVNPTYKLLGWFNGRIGSTSERPRMDFSVEKTSLASPTVRELKAVDAKVAALWVKHWKESGFLQ